MSRRKDMIVGFNPQPMMRAHVKAVEADKRTDKQKLVDLEPLYERMAELRKLFSS